MGNAISNASPAINPTYDLDWDLEKGKVVLKERHNAEYNFEELRFKSKEEALKRENVREFLERKSSCLKHEIREAREEIRMNEAALEEIEIYSTLVADI